MNTILYNFIIRFKTMFWINEIKEILALPKMNDLMYMNKIVAYIKYVFMINLHNFIRKSQEGLRHKLT